MDYRGTLPILQHIEIKGTKLFDPPNNKADVMEPKIGAGRKLHVKFLNDIRSVFLSGGYMREIRPHPQRSFGGKDSFAVCFPLERPAPST